MVLHAWKLPGKKVGKIRTDDAKEMELSAMNRFLQENRTMFRVRGYKRVYYGASCRTTYSD